MIVKEAGGVVISYDYDSHRCKLSLKIENPNHFPVVVENLIWRTGGGEWTEDVWHVRAHDSFSTYASQSSHFKIYDRSNGCLIGVMH